MRPIIVIPARLAATRLPNKPLADIGGLPMIIHVLRRAEEAAIGPVLVAAGDQAICDAVAAAGGSAILTNPDLPSGSDRIFAAMQAFDQQEDFNVVVNLQGDLPTLDPALIRLSVEILSGGADISTLVSPITRHEELHNPNVVKAAVNLAAGDQVGRALYFSRQLIPAGEGGHYHHIGLYAYRRSALQRFVQAPPAPIELREKLEQLRALALGMRIDAAVVDTVPLGVDTPEDLARARELLA